MLANFIVTMTNLQYIDVSINMKILAVLQQIYKNFFRRFYYKFNNVYSNKQ